MSTGKAQHIVPKFYLKRFLTPGWVYQQGAPAPRKVNSPRNVSVEDWYYTAQGDENDPRIDEFNARIENYASPLLTLMLNSRKPPSDDTKRAFAWFIANLHVRVPRTTQGVGFQMLELAEHMDKDMERLASKFGISVEPNAPLITFKTGESSRIFTRAEWSEELDKLRKQAALGKPLMSTTYSLMIDLAPVIAGMSWHIVDAPPDCCFVTCDNPVGLTDITNNPVGAGWANPNVWATLPLSPKRLLLLFGFKTGDQTRKLLSAEDVERINLRTIFLAYRSVYSYTQYEKADAWRRGVLRHRSSQTRREEP